MSGTLRFTKMVGAGNDFLIVDAAQEKTAAASLDWKRAARVLCDRHQGVGADGVLVLERSLKADVRMRVINADGSEAEMCGNGARCVARFVAERSQGGAGRARTVTIDTAAGLLSAVVSGERVRMRMTDPTELRTGLSLDVDGRRLRASSVNTGVPHVVVPVSELEAIDVARLGRELRHHRQYGPKGTNVNFIQPDPEHKDRLRVRTYERGVEGETLACGTGVTASAVIHGLSQVRGSEPRRCRISVQTRSGDVLEVSFEAAPNGRQVHVTDVMLEGPARRVFEGEVPWPLKGRR